MAEQTGIQWCDATFNPWHGCEKVSPACAHCYAETQSKRYGFDIWGPGHEFRFLSEANWAKPHRWEKLAREGLLPDGTKNVDGHRPRIFTASMADVFEERDELDGARRRLFRLIEQTPQLDWLVLTKRPEFARDWLFRWDSELARGRLITRDDDHFGWGCPPNVWMGVSIENARFTWRADVLREIPAAVRFISAEPLLGSLFSSARLDPCYGAGSQEPSQTPSRDGVPLSGREPGSGIEAGQVDKLGSPGTSGRKPLDLSGIDWVIIGGESGPGARPFHLEHAREIIGHAVAESYHRTDFNDDSAVAVFVKQLGAKPIAVTNTLDGSSGLDLSFKLADRKGGDMDEWPADLRIREFPRTAVTA